MPYRMIVDNKIKTKGIFLENSKLCFTLSVCLGVFFVFGGLVFFFSFGGREQVFLALRTLLEQLDM